MGVFGALWLACCLELLLPNRVERQKSVFMTGYYYYLDEAWITKSFVDAKQNEEFVFKSAPNIIGR
jgi:hypothetical protein